MCSRETKNKGTYVQSSAVPTGNCLSESTLAEFREVLVESLLYSIQQAKYKICPRCSGKGWLFNKFLLCSAPCYVCDGEGKLSYIY